MVSLVFTCDCAYRQKSVWARTQDNYCNPRCACAPRITKLDFVSIVLGLTCHVTRVDPPANWSHPLHTLQMPALQEYNISVVQCALIIFGRPYIFTDEATLAIQGALMCATSLWHMTISYFLYIHNLQAT